MIDTHEILQVPDDMADLLGFWNQAMNALPEPDITIPETVLLNRILALAQVGMVDARQTMAMAWAIGKGYLPLEDFDNFPEAARRAQEEQETNDD